MPKFRNREEYEQWKAERMAASQQRAAEADSGFPNEAPAYAPDILYDEPEKENRAGKYVIRFLVVAAIVVVGYVVYTQFIQEGKWTDDSYTNRKFGFTLNIPEGWEKTKLDTSQKMMTGLLKPSGTSLCFVLSPPDDNNTRYALIAAEMPMVQNGKQAMDMARDTVSMLATAFKNQGVQADYFSRNVTGRPFPFVRAVNGNEIFISGVISYPFKMFYAQYSGVRGKSEQRFWDSIESMEIETNQVQG